MAFFLKVVSFVAIFQLGATVCPGGWEENAGHCYHFSHDEEEWSNAKKFCDLWDSELVSVNTGEEQIFISQHAFIVKDLAYWTSGSNFNNGTWVWQDGSLILSFSNWALGQPDNHHSDESCLSMQRTTHYTWHDRSCKDELGYICEKAIPIPTAPVVIVG